MDVVILAGGLGTRLRSVVSEVPKCMAPVAGKPFLFYLLQYLKSYNVGKVVLSVGYLREKIYEWIELHRGEFPYEISYAVEEQPLGTGGAIRLSLEQCSDDCVAILNGDTFFDVDLNELCEEHKISDALLTIALKPMRNFSRYGNVELSTEGRIEAFKEKALCEEGVINGGLYVANRSALVRELSEKAERFSFETDVMQKMAGKDVMAGYISRGYFIDIGVPEDYARADREFKIASGAVDLSAYSGIGDTLFLDRDGVVNRLLPGDYVKCIEEFEFLPNLLPALAIWSTYFKRVIVVTNQRGVGKGVMSEASLNKIHEYMKGRVEKSGGRIDAIYYCTALSDSDPNRKPNPGMAIRAMSDFGDIDLSKSLMIGDSNSDREFSQNAMIGNFICV